MALVTPGDGEGEQEHPATRWSNRTSALAFDVSQPGRRTLGGPRRATPDRGRKHWRGRRGLRGGDRDRDRCLPDPHSSHPETCTASRAARYRDIGRHDSRVHARCLASSPERYRYLTGDDSVPITSGTRSCSARYGECSCDDSSHDQPGTASAGVMTRIMAGQVTCHRSRLLGWGPARSRVITGHVSVPDAR